MFIYLQRYECFSPVNLLRYKVISNLIAMVQSKFEKVPTSGDLFVFLNKRGEQMKLLFWDRNGF